MNKSTFTRQRRRLVAVALSLVSMFALGSVSASAQSRRDIERLGDGLVKIEAGELTLESIDFRDQTARLSLGLDVRNGLVPVSLKDFDYDLQLFGEQFISGRYDGALKVGGRRSSRVNLPIVVNLRSIPNMVWSAFRNRGQVSYQLETGFTLPLFITEKRFDQSFAGEVPLKSLVDAASILRASRMSGGGGASTGGRITDRISDRIRVGGWPF